MKRLLLLLVLLALAYLATGVYQVRPGELAVVRRCGRILGDPRLPGLNLGLPWGLDRVDCVAVDKQRQLTVGHRPPDEEGRENAAASQLLTGDNHLLDARATVFYRVDRNQVADFVLNGERRDALLVHAAEEALAETLATVRMDPVLLGQARTLEPRLHSHLVNRLNGFRLGVVVDSVSLTYAQPPAPLADVFREVNAMRNYRDRVRTEAEQASETEVSAARKYGREANTAAQVAARDRTTRAAADADAFRALVRQANTPEALFTLYLKEMTEVLRRMQVKTISDNKVDQTIVLPGGEK